MTDEKLEKRIEELENSHKTMMDLFNQMTLERKEIADITKRIKTLEVDNALWMKNTETIAELKKRLGGEKPAEPEEIKDEHDQLITGKHMEDDYICRFPNKCEDCLYFQDGRGVYGLATRCNVFKNWVEHNKWWNEKLKPRYFMKKLKTAIKWLMPETTVDDAVVYVFDYILNFIKESHPTIADIQNHLEGLKDEIKLSP